MNLGKCWILFGSMFISYHRNFSSALLHRFPITRTVRTFTMEPELNIPPQGHVPSLRPQVLVLAGATSVGKSAVSMELCKKLNAEIVIADSVQVYQGLDIGANKPTLEDQQAVPHHLIDICEPNHQMNTAEFCEEALRAIADITSRNKTAIVVGGSTMWIQWLVHGKPDAPKASEFAIQRAKHMLDHFELEKRWEDGLDILKSLDGERAARLPKNDWYRLRRYLEIAIDLNEGGVNCSYSDEEGNLNNSKRLTGKRQSFLKDFDVRCFFLMEAREQLYHTIDCRCELMLKAGLLEEVFRLLSSGKLHPSFPISRSIGYRQVIEYFCRDINENDMTAFQEFLRDFATSTRNYAKKQCNWYRKDEQFLFLKMDRKDHSDESKNSLAGIKSLSPYEQCGEEILNWLSNSETDFQDLLAKQMKISTTFNRFLATGTLDINHHIQDEDEYRVLCFLTDRDAIKCSTIKNRHDGSAALKALLDACHLKNEIDVQQPDEVYLSALDVDVRAGEVGDRYHAMKNFNSRLLRQDNSRFKPFVEESDRYRYILWNQHQSLMESFASAFDKKNS